MGEKVTKFLNLVYKELWSWGIKLLFSVGLGVLVWIFTAMTPWLFLLFVFSLAVTIITGIVIVKQVISDLRSIEPSKTKREVHIDKELSERFGQLIAEGEAGIAWTPEEIELWVFQIGFAIRPLFKPAMIDQFLAEIGGTKLSGNTKRLACLNWLRSACLHHNILVYRPQKTGSMPNSIFA